MYSPQINAWSAESLIPIVILYNYNPVELFPTIDIDECQSTTVCTQVCTNSVGSYRCSCGAGYVLASNRYDCNPLESWADGTCRSKANDFVHPAWGYKHHAISAHLFLYISRNNSCLLSKAMDTFSITFLTSTINNITCALRCMELMKIRLIFNSLKLQIRSEFPFCTELTADVWLFAHSDTFM